MQPQSTSQESAATGSLSARGPADMSARRMALRVLIAFLLTFIAARVLVYLIISRVIRRGRERNADPAGDVRDVLAASGIRFLACRALDPDCTRGHVSPHRLSDPLGRGQAITVVGLLLLIATPIVRVAISVLAFVYQQDRAFVGITSTVLVLLSLSLLLGRLHG